MTSFTAKHNKRTKTVLFLVYPGVKLLDIAGPMQVFEDASRHENEFKLYQTALVSKDGGLIESDTPLSISTDVISSWANREIDTLVVSGGEGTRNACLDQDLIDDVIQLSKKSSRITSVCTGAFILASAGLLDGRRAVTHWQSCDKLASGFPEIDVEVNPIFIKDGSLWTSAGVTAGIDMALAIVEEDFGRKIAVDTARALVTYMVRPGGQSQFSKVLEKQLTDKSGRFDNLHQWIRDHLDEDLRVEQLARKVNMSPRNFSRLYTADTNTTPAKAVESFRLEAACRMLEETNLSIGEIAGRSGFSDDERMRRAFLRLLHISPGDYRLRFQGS